MKRFFNLVAIIAAAIAVSSCLAGKYMANYALCYEPHGVADIERTRHKADSLCPGSTAWYDSLKTVGLPMQRVQQLLSMVIATITLCSSTWSVCTGTSLTTMCYSPTSSITGIPRVTMPRWDGMTVSMWRNGLKWLTVFGTTSLWCYMEYRWEVLPS